MHPTSTNIDPALLEVRLGSERWREAKHASWRGTRIDDGAMSAAAELVARQELRAARTGLLAFLILTLAGIVAFIGVGDGWSIALLSLGIAGSIGATAGSLVLARSAKIHAEGADHDGLNRLIDGHSPTPG